MNTHEILPDLRIEAWELPNFVPDTPAALPTSMRIWVEGCPYLVRDLWDTGRRPFLMFRSERPEATNRYCLWPGIYSPGWPGRVEPLTSIFQGTVEKAEEMLRGAILAQGLRIVCLDANFKLAQVDDWLWRLEISAEGGFWHNRQTRNACDWIFSAETFEELANSPVQQVLERILAWKDDPASDCARAFKWAGLDEDRSRLLALSTARGSFEEFENLVRLFLWGQNDVVLEDRVGWVVRIYDDRPSEQPIETGALKWEFSDGPTEDYRPQHWVDFWNSVQEYFDIRVDQKVRNSHLHAQWNWANGFPYIIWIPMPTEHERIEAHLQLREWVETHLSPEQGQMILSKW